MTHTTYRWERRRAEDWIPVPAAALPDILQTKKSVLFASMGRVFRVQDDDGNPTDYRMVKVDSEDT